MAPTLLIVGGADQAVLELNRQALAALSCDKTLKIIAGAGRLFEGHGQLYQVMQLAGDWFQSKLSQERPPT